ncbi:MAG: nicotinate-nucleotide--dimethylbenzimidazole phosphoribosyltransferase [Gemmataceae bacterium]|nr:nicotinate-nucleotide--dimethylbenzimidazole phosphoribosyltransferase [Gemmataceae bacterium]
MCLERPGNRNDPPLARAHLDALVKPPGSLGRLEDLAVRLCVIQRTLAPRTTPRRVVLFAADHGVVVKGLTAWPAHTRTPFVRHT